MTVAYRIVCTLACALLGSFARHAPAEAATYTVSSPNGTISFAVTEQINGSLTYKVSYGSQTILDSSPLGITTKVGAFTTGLTFVSQTTGTVNETYSLPGRKKATYTNSANTLTLRYSKGSAVIDVLIRAYDDGIAYRYAIPGSGSASISSESSGFKPPSGTGGWAFTWRSDYEGFYDYRSSAQLELGNYGMPLLLSINNNSHWALLTEANVYNANGTYHTSRLVGGGSGTGVLNVAFAPEQTSAVSTSHPFQTPWRAVVIGDHLSDLVESTLVSNLNPPSEISNTSWIKPGRAAWSWWSDEPSGADLAKQKNYVDAAAALGLEYVTVDCCWVAADIPTIVQYAAVRNVKIFIWTDAAAIDTQAEVDSKLPLWKSWGVAGLKVDFFMNDSQSMMATYDLTATIFKDGASDQQIATQVLTVNSADTLSIALRAHGGAAVHIGTTSLAFDGAGDNSYEAEAPGNTIDGASRTTCNGCSGREKVGYLGGTNTLRFNSIAAPTAGSYQLELFYASADPRTAHLSVNGGTATAVSLPSSGGWDVVGSAALPVTLNAGSSNSVLITNLSGGWSPDIDRVATRSVVEAEAGGNTLTSPASAASCSDCSGGQKVGGIGGSGTLRFNSVPAVSAGSKTVTIRYTAAVARTAYISVNGGTAIAVSFPATGGANVPGVKTIALSLNAGTNTITFLNSGGVAPDIDRIDVTN
jgi:alpha-glucosidase